NKNNIISKLYVYGAKVYYFRFYFRLNYKKIKSFKINGFIRKISIFGSKDKNFALVNERDLKGIIIALILDFHICIGG
ncbi:hypothetical protein D9776_08545, partial [Campylobacter upsaliensis]|nr:hypothetical protein [Campylobacter upsaliensis]